LKRLLSFLIEEKRGRFIFCPINILSGQCEK